MIRSAQTRPDWPDLTDLIDDWCIGGCTDGYIMDLCEFKACCDEIRFITLSFHYSVYTVIIIRAQCLHSRVQTTWQHVTVWHVNCSTCQQLVRIVIARLMPPTSRRSLDSSWSVAHFTETTTSRGVRLAKNDFGSVFGSVSVFGSFFALCVV